MFDGYSLQLLDEASVVLANRSISLESRSERLEGLMSGKWYRVKVVTLSGGVPSLEATAEGQTRKSLHKETASARPHCFRGEATSLLMLSIFGGH